MAFKVSIKRCKEVVEHYYANGENAKITADYFGIQNPGTVIRYERTYRNHLQHQQKDLPYTIVKPKSPEPTAEELIEAACTNFQKRENYEDKIDYLPIKMQSDLPICLCFVGDPHVDDDGCNWPLLKEHVAIMKNTPGMFGVNLGDYNNNWIGRLQKLYGNQEIQAKHAWTLVEWLLKEVPWIVLIAGNHDMWSGDRDPIRWMLNHERVFYNDWQAKFKMVFPNGAEFKVCAKHDFKGHSMYNKNHGPARYAMFSKEADLYAAGHRHTWKTETEEDDYTHNIRHVIRASGYKSFDKYSMVGGFARYRFGSTIPVIIDPAEPLESRAFIVPSMNIAAEYLTWKRGQFKKAV